MSMVARLFAMDCNVTARAALVQCTARRNDIVPIEGGKVKPLAQDKDVIREIARAAGRWADCDSRRMSSIPGQKCDYYCAGRGAGYSDPKGALRYLL